MNGNTPFRLWKCSGCGVELDEADGYFSTIIDGWEGCEVCVKKEPSPLMFKIKMLMHTFHMVNKIVWPDDLYWDVSTMDEIEESNMEEVKDG